MPQTVARRTPFSENPVVGARGQQTHQRILDAALRAFGERGYRGASIEQIATYAGCSRITVYQYFANKEELFRHLAVQVARQVSASTDTVDPLTPDLDGWTALRAWVGRYAEIHARFEPVFHSYEGDEELAAIAGATGAETIDRLRARLGATTVAPRRLDAVLGLLLEALNHTLDVSEILRAVAPDSYAAEQVQVAVTDVVHRTLFGLQPDVNVHAAAGSAPPALRSAPAGLDVAAVGVGPATGALDALVQAGREVFVAKGYHGTVVADVVAAAGVSHGTFYRYFTNKDDLARTLVAHAVGAVGTVASAIPTRAELEAAGGSAALRRWLTRYHRAHVDEAAMLQVWVDAALQAPALRAESAPVLDRGRRRMATYLDGRGWGDANVDAVVMVALLGVLGARPRSTAEIDAAALVVERGLLGR